MITVIYSLKEDTDYMIFDVDWADPETRLVATADTEAFLRELDADQREEPDGEPAPGGE